MFPERIGDASCARLCARDVRAPSVHFCFAKNSAARVFPLFILGLTKRSSISKHERQRGQKKLFHFHFPLALCDSARNLENQKEQDNSSIAMAGPSRCAASL